MRTPGVKKFGKRVLQFPKEKTHCLAQGLSGKFLHIRRWLRGGFLQRTSMQRTSLHSSVHMCPLPPSQPAAFPSDLLRPSPNYRGTSGLPVSLIFRNLALLLAGDDLDVHTAAILYGVDELGAVGCDAQAGRAHRGGRLDPVLPR